MDARPVSLFVSAFVTICLLAAGDLSASGYRTPNFVVMAPDPAFARQVGDEAERFRRELAMLWLGRELPTWPQPCPITVEIAPHAGGETSFMFVPDSRGGSQPAEWRMKIYGPPQRILDSVLPHEVTHTIFATHFGRPLPRWADEGACTTVEHETERQRNHRMLIQFLSTGRGIPFNHMFAMKQYPSDILPLYSQGYSLARYLIMQKGHRHFVDFVGEGMDQEVPGQEPQTWNRVSEKYYGYEDLSDLQVDWLAWVREGCPAINDGQTSPEVIAQATPPASPSPPRDADAEVAAAAAGSEPVLSIAANESWYVRQSRSGGDATLQRPAAFTHDAATGEVATPYSPGSIGNSRHTDSVAHEANSSPIHE